MKNIFSGLASTPKAHTFSVEIKSISKHMNEMVEKGKLNSPSYRLLKTAVSKLKDFENLNRPTN